MIGMDLDRVPDRARDAWIRLRDELRAILGDDLVALWAYGGTVSADPSASFGDLDTFAVVRQPIDAETAHAIDEAEAAIERDAGIEWDAWYVVDADARQGAMPRHAWRDRLNESWAIDRAHWLAGRYVLLHGAGPAEVVSPPTAAELNEALRAEVDHLERHVEAGDTDPFEATYAFLNGSRIIRAIETGDVAISKREAGPWGVEHLPDRWHPAVQAAMRAYEHEATAEDEATLAREMAPFVAYVGERMRSL